MAILDTLDEVKSKINEIKRKYRFRKERMQREDAAALQVTLATCRGQLEVCKKDFNRAINNQSRNIAEGLSKGADVSVQELILWDAAIGYLLVRDAIFALETICSYDAVSHAYEMLDTAMRQVSGKKRLFPKRMAIGSTNERNAYGYITSSTALQEKIEMVEGFFSSLKVNGDIEGHLAQAISSTSAAANRAYAVADDSASKKRAETVAALKDNDNGAVDLDQFQDSLENIRPPQDSE